MPNLNVKKSIQSTVNTSKKIASDVQSTAKQLNICHIHVTTQKRTNQKYAEYQINHIRLQRVYHQEFIAQSNQYPIYHLLKWQHLRQNLFIQLIKRHKGC